MKIFAMTEIIDGSISIKIQKDDEKLDFHSGESVWVHWIPGWEVILPDESLKVSKIKKMNFSKGNITQDRKGQTRMIANYPGQGRRRKLKNPQKSFEKYLNRIFG